MMSMEMKLKSLMESKLELLKRQLDRNQDTIDSLTIV